MSGPYGGNYSNGGFDLVTPLRRMFGKMDDRRSELIRVNREHEFATHRIAMEHQNSLERILVQHGLSSQENALQREHLSSEAAKQREFDGQQGVANRTLEYNRMETASTEAQKQREHEVNRLNVEGGNAVLLERERGRQARLNTRATGRETRRNYDHASSTTGAGKPVTAGPGSVTGSTPPAKRAAAKKATPKKPTQPRRAQPSA